ncbi:MAG TPA: hypothetical protein VHD88_04390 [Pyrinomonadaceae bacterium]|nr:hypothetical protein [Pyrinomonadaceae bacterium]
MESILSEIRERVRVEEERSASAVEQIVREDQAYDSSVASDAQTESLARVSAHLTTTARAWDRLPPMISNRSGASARLELWVKARLKTLSRWFTWEQVNFNAAVHHALSETLQALSAYEQEITRMRAELSKETEVRREKFERSSRELTALRASIEAQAAEIRKRDANVEARSADIEARSAAIETRAAEMATEMNAARLEIDEARVMMNAARVEIDEARTEMTSRLAELAGELRERDEQLLAEQRVCFKQLSLETSEAAVLEDRGRRAIESRLAKLEKLNGEK